MTVYEILECALKHCEHRWDFYYDTDPELSREYDQKAAEIRKYLEAQKEFDEANGEDELWKNR